MVALLHPSRELAQLDTKAVGDANQGCEGRVRHSSLQLTDSLKWHFEAIGELLMGQAGFVAQLLDRFAERLV